MTIQDAAEQTGLSVDTIRFYEKSKMLPPIARDGRGWRMFSPSVLEWLTVLARLRATGMPLEDMQRFATLVHTTAPDDQTQTGMTSAEERLEILYAHKARLMQKRVALDAAEHYLDHKIFVYSTLHGKVTS